MGSSLSLLSIGPRLTKRHGRLIATSAWRACVLTLGMLYRQVIVDPKEQVVIVRRRAFWFFKRARRIPFHAIKAIGYGCTELYEEGWFGAWTHKTAENFTVQLKLHSGSNIHLFYFYGGGPFANTGPLPDWVYWQEFVLDLSGTQAEESRVFVELLTRIIGAPIEPPSL